MTSADPASKTGIRRGPAFHMTDPPLADSHLRPWLFVHAARTMQAAYVDAGAGPFNFGEGGGIKPGATPDLAAFADRLAVVAFVDVATPPESMFGREPMLMTCRTANVRARLLR
jgi:hypothetical protein